MTLDTKIKNIETDLTAVYKKVIKEKGLIDSGKLYNSISFKMTKTSDGYSFKMTSMDYFSVLDKKYGITDAVYKTVEYNRINNNIQDVYVEIVYKELGL